MVIIITAKVIYMSSSDNEGRSERCLCVFVMGNVMPGEGFACALILGRVGFFPSFGVLVEGRDGRVWERSVGYTISARFNEWYSNYQCCSYSYVKG